MEANEVSALIIIAFVFMFVFLFLLKSILDAIMAMNKKKDNIEVRYIFVSEKEIKKDSLLDLIRKVTETNEHRSL